MEPKRESFIMYKSIVDWLMLIKDPEEFRLAVATIFNYWIFDAEPDFENLPLNVKILFASCKPLMNSANKRYAKTTNWVSKQQ